VPSEIAAAILCAQFACAERVTASPLAIGEAFRAAFADREASGRVRGPVISPGNGDKGRLSYLLTRDRDDRDDRDAMIARRLERDFQAVFHHVPLHSSPAGSACSRTHGALVVTDDASARLLRLPLWADLSDAELALVVDTVDEALT
jgi:dTDP-4-amino-4,6-dideoxygalactose transaminase